MNKLRDIRKQRKMSQSELAEKVRHADPTVSQMTISVLEQGELYPSEKLRDAICEALHCTEEDLYDGIEAMFVPAVSPEISENTKLLMDIFGERTGKRKYIDRASLRDLVQAKTGRYIPDRGVRKMVEKARQEGMIICNGQDGNGYFLPETKEDLVRQYRQNESRALAILRQQKAIRRLMREGADD